MTLLNDTLYIASELVATVLGLFQKKKKFKALQLSVAFRIFVFIWKGISEYRQ